MYQFTLSDPEAVKYCFEVIESGGLFVANLGRVYTLVGDAYDPTSCERISGAKGHPEGFTTGWLGLDMIQHFFDSAQVMPLTTVYLTDGAYLNERFGGRVLVRYPVSRRGQTLLPPWMISSHGGGHYFQQFSFVGMPEAYEIEKACARAVASLHPECQVPMAAARSANYHGRGSIVDPGDAESFCRDSEIELVIHDESVGKGSYAIFVLGPGGNVLTRYETCSADEVAYFLDSLPGSEQSA